MVLNQTWTQSHCRVCRAHRCLPIKGLLTWAHSNTFKQVSLCKHKSDWLVCWAAESRLLLHQAPTGWADERNGPFRGPPHTENMLWEQLVKDLKWTVTVQCSFSFQSGTVEWARGGNTTDYSSVLLWMIHFWTVTFKHIFTFTYC